METLSQPRAYAVRRTLFAPIDLHAAIVKLGFVQADPIRATARVQDLILRHRVANYRAGDLEAASPSRATDACQAWRICWSERRYSFAAVALLVHRVRAVLRLAHDPLRIEHHVK